MYGRRHSKERLQETKFSPTKLKFNITRPSTTRGLNWRATEEGAWKLNKTFHNHFILKGMKKGRGNTREKKDIAMEFDHSKDLHSASDGEQSLNMNAATSAPSVAAAAASSASALCYG